MSDAVYSILIAGLETLLLPAILRWLKRQVKQKWLVNVLLILIVLLMTMVLGTVVSVLSYHISKV
ncbi:MAG: hypothetical protein K2H72_08075 [Muribaculaceae bacterium]|nr:hypothetical protein [Muribaculaceae bacterium]